MLSFVIFACITACSFPKTESGEYTFFDDLGEAVSISNSDKIAALHASFADCWLLAGGTLAAVTSDAIAEHGLDVGDAAIVGTAKTTDLEALVASGATVALLSLDISAHVELRATLMELGIKCIYFRVDTFEDYASVMRRLCTATGRDDLFCQNVTCVGEKIAQISETVGNTDGRRILLMRAYSSGIKAKRDDTLAGVILKEFGLLNIADEHPSLLEDISLEHIVAADPDYIFVLTMGSEEAALNYLYANVESNPAFAALRAVSHGNYHVLPKSLFHHKPNERWAESYEYLAKILYPELFSGK